MDTAEIRKSASLCKSEFVNKAHVGSHAHGAVRVIRRTELPIRRAGREITTGDTVAASGPCPLHRVAHGDIDCARIERKRPTRCHRHSDRRAPSRWHAAHGWPAVLIENAQGWPAFSAGQACVFLGRFSPHQKSCRNENCHPKN